MDRARLARIRIPHQGGRLHPREIGAFWIHFQAAPLGGIGVYPMAGGASNRLRILRLREGKKVCKVRDFTLVSRRVLGK